MLSLALNSLRALKMGRFIFRNIAIYAKADKAMTNVIRGLIEKQSTSNTNNETTRVKTLKSVSKQYAITVFVS